MRKFLCFLIVICVLSSSFIFVSAQQITEEADSLYFDVLAYTEFFSTPYTGAVFYLPQTMPMTYVDAIIECEGLSSVQFGNSDGTVGLSFKSFGNNLYRVYGPVNLTADRFTLYVRRSSEIVNFKTVHIYNGDIVRDDIDGGATIIAPGFSGTSIDYGPTDSSNMRTWIGADYTEGGSFSVQFHPDTNNWQSYDFLDILVQIKCHDINSISCYFLGVSVPVQSSFIDSGNYAQDTFMLSLRVDLRNLDKSQSVYPIIFINGHETPLIQNKVDIYQITGITFFPSYFDDTFFLSHIFELLKDQFHNINGWIFAQTQSIVNGISSIGTNISTWINAQTSSLISGIDSFKNAVSGWFTTLFSDLNDIKNSLTGTVEDGEEIQENIDNSKQEMQDYKDAMESLPVPDIEDVDLDLDDNSGNAAITSVGRVLVYGINNEVTLPIFMLLFTFAMVGYALYGKR